MKVSELTGPALDWAVAKAEGWEINHHAEGGWFLSNDIETMPDETLPEFSTDWAEGGPIIEREKIELVPKGSEHWDAFCSPDDHTPSEGPTPLIAAMRCYVASKLGDEVDVPDGL